MTKEENYREKLLKIKTDKKLTCRQFGEILGVSFRTVESWKQGRTIPNTSVILLAEIKFKKKLF